MRPTDTSQADTGGTDEWFRDAYPRLRRFAAVVAPPTVAPDDLVQDALVRVLRSGPLDDIEDPVPYLCRTMANLATDRKRRWQTSRSVHARLGPRSLGSAPAYPSDLSYLSTLSPRERGAVYLHDVEGLPFDEVGELLGCSAAAARQAAVRGRTHLRETIEVTQ